MLFSVHIVRCTENNGTYHMRYSKNTYILVRVQKIFSTWNCTRYFWYAKCNYEVVENTNIYKFCLYGVNLEDRSIGIVQIAAKKHATIN